MRRLLVLLAVALLIPTLLDAQEPRSFARPRSRTRIVGGLHSPPGEAPWVVAFAFRQPNGRLFQYCGGTLVSPEHVITAAHCDVRMSDVAIIGRNALSDSSEGTEIAVRRFSAHPEYRPNTSDYDLAVVRLAGTAAGASLPIASSVPSVGTPVTTLGWGRLSEEGASSTLLQKVTLPLLSRVDCNRAYDGGITERMLCAGAPGMDSCQGDSGGPLVVGLGTPDVQLVGAVSFGIGCARPEYPGVYSNVPAMLGWLRTQLGPETVPPSPNPPPTTPGFFSGCQKPQS